LCLCQAWKVNGHVNERDFDIISCCEFWYLIYSDIVVLVVCHFVSRLHVRNMTHRYTTAQAFPPLHIINRELYDPIVYLKAHSLEHESPTLAGAGFEQVLGLEYIHKFASVSMLIYFFCCIKLCVSFFTRFTKVDEIIQNSSKVTR
jgi:hypothetical protein